ncbi:MAG TPA: Kazal-type serine protease inhibitor family protein [Pseudomonadota bacterium]|nr:Kazal-type serine protease inhibitor family protein [Pseudomonadota bacterium]
MRRSALFSLAVPSLFALLSGLSACTPTAEEAQGTQASAVGSPEPTSGSPTLPAGTDGTETLAAYSNSTYFIVNRPDLRRCVYPLCGGYFSQRVNQATTVCSDGTAQPECRILEFDYSALSLDPMTLSSLQGKVQAGQALLRGQIVKTAPIAGRTYDKLVVSEAWEARSVAPTPSPSPTPTRPSGTFSRLRELPVACPACPPYRQEVLNTTAAGVPIAAIEYDATRFPAALVKELTTALSASDVGLLMAGSRGGSSGRPKFVASEAYTPVRGRPGGKVGDACGGRGMPTCNAPLFCKWEPSAFCGRADASGICSVKPDVCIKVYKPVCGCDRKTYGNSCEANAAGVSVDYEGVCR